MGAFYSGNIETFKNPKILKKCFKKGKQYARKVKQQRSQGVLESVFWRPPQIK
jgi:hypothetical protein